MANKGNKANAGTATAKAKQTPVTAGSHEFQVESGVAVPESRSSWSVFENMNIGDSFLIPSDGTTKGNTEAKKISRQAYQSALKTHKMKVSIRTVADGIRIWRVG